MVSFWKHPQAYGELVQLFRRATGIELPRVVPFLRTPAFVFFRRDWKPQLQPISYKCPLVWPLTLNAVDLDHCLRPFIAGMASGHNERPRRPRWVDGFGTAVASIASMFLAAGVMYLPVAGVRRMATSVCAPIQRSLLDSFWTTYSAPHAGYSFSAPAYWLK